MCRFSLNPAQLVGPYASSRRLALSDHILIGRTGFSINRFDWGVWEDRGTRRAMEDKSVVIQVCRLVLARGGRRVRGGGGQRKGRVSGAVLLAVVSGMSMLWGDERRSG